MSQVIDAPATMAAQQAQAGAVVAQQPQRGAIVGASLSSASLIHVIAEAARDPSVDIEKMERLWAMHERLTSRANEEAFNAAMNKAQSEMGRVAADAGNQQTRSVYATYGKLDKAVRPIYTKHGFSISFNEGEGAPEGFARILAYVSHSAGHTRTYKLDMPADGKGAKGGDVMTKTHATGSAHSYGRRYLLKDIFNIAIGEEDNDGNAAAEDEPKGPDAAAYEAMLDSFRDAALNGEAALRRHYSKNTPTDEFWKRHSRELKEAARRADAEAAR